MDVLWKNNVKRWQRQIRGKYMRNLTNHVEEICANERFIKNECKKMTKAKKAKKIWQIWQITWRRFALMDVSTRKRKTCLAPSLKPGILNEQRDLLWKISWDILWDILRDILWDIWREILWDILWDVLWCIVRNIVRYIMRYIVRYIIKYIVRYIVKYIMR